MPSVCVPSTSLLERAKQILLKATKFVKGAGEMLGYPISTPSKSASSRVGLGCLEVGQDGTNSTSFSHHGITSSWRSCPSTCTQYISTVGNKHSIHKTFASSQSQNTRKLTERYYIHFPKTKCNPNQSPRTKLTKFENQKKTMSQYWRSTRWYCVLVFENEKENKISQCRWHCAGIENQKKSLNSTTTALS